MSRVTVMVVTETKADARGDSHCRGQALPVSRSGVGGIAPAVKGRLGPFVEMMEGGIESMGGKRGGNGENRKKDVSKKKEGRRR